MICDVIAVPWCLQDFNSDSILFLFQLFDSENLFRKTILLYILQYTLIP